MAFDINVYAEKTTDSEKIEYLYDNKDQGGIALLTSTVANKQKNYANPAIIALTNSYNSEGQLGRKSKELIDEFIEAQPKAIKTLKDELAKVAGATNASEAFAANIGAALQTGDWENPDFVNFKIAAVKAISAARKAGVDTGSVGEYSGTRLYKNDWDALIEAANKLAKVYDNNSETNDDLIEMAAATADENATVAVGDNSSDDSSGPQATQCALMLDFLQRARSFVYNKDNPATIMSDVFNDTDKYTIDTYKGRIYGLWTDRPDLFLNNCYFNPNFKRYFSRDSTSTPEKEVYDVSLFYVGMMDKKNDSGDLIARENYELKLKKEEEDCYLTQLSVEYNGTNPATARKDVVVKMTWSLSSFNILNKDISFSKTNSFKFYELITVPSGVAKGSTITGGSIRSQYSPDYNRIRVKFKVRSDLKQYDLDNSGYLQFEDRPFTTANGETQYVSKPKYKSNSGEIVDDYFLDLTLTSHDISRSDDKGNVKVTIEYRAYFESLLSMPFMDALATEQTMTERLARDANLIQLSKDCQPKTFKEILRLNRIADMKEARDSYNNKLFLKGNFRNATIKQSVFTNIRNGSWQDSDLLTWGELTSSPSTEGATTTETEDPDLTTKAAAAATGVETPQNTIEKKKSQIEQGAIRLGDILDAAISQLYDENGSLRPEFSHLNLKFLVAPVVMNDPFDSIGTIIFNPLEIPVSYSFFLEWYNANVSQKKIAYYPVLNFIRDLMERLINGILFEDCVNNALPDEKPPILRTGFFHDNRPTAKALHNQSRENFYIDVDYFLKNKSDAREYEKIFKYTQTDPLEAIINDTPETEPNNYCVIYMQNRNFFDLQRGTLLKQNPWVPTMRSGIHFNDGYIKDLKFTKKSESTGLREARYFNSNNGLNIMSNVYDFNFKLDNRKPNNMIFPGQLLWFELWDFVQSDRNPNAFGSLSNVLSMGGYYMVKKVSQTFDFDKEGNTFNIIYDTLWSGNDANAKLRRTTEEGKTIEDNRECLNLYTDTFERAYGENAAEVRQIVERRNIELPTYDASAGNEALRGAFFAGGARTITRSTRQNQLEAYLKQFIRDSKSWAAEEDFSFSSGDDRISFQTTKASVVGTNEFTNAEITVTANFSDTDETTTFKLTYNPNQDIFVTSR